MGARSRRKLFMPYASFERADAARTIAHRNRLRRGRSFRRLVVRRRLEKILRRHEEEVTGDGAAEIEEPVIVAWRAADEHVLQHLLDRARRAAVTDEVGAELTLRCPAERHVVAQYLDLPATLLDRRQCAVCRGRLDRVIELDIGQLGAADDAFLH